MKRAAFSAFISALRPGAEDAAREPAPPNVLVCEDDGQLRMLIEFMLGEAGFHVLLASSGEEAVQLAADAGDIDVLVTDLGMPTMSGPDLIEELKAANPGLPVVVISGYPPGAVPGETKPRADAFLQKPFDPAVLVDTIEKLLDPV